MKLDASPWRPDGLPPLCACQYGSCGWCANGIHRQCAFLDHGRGTESPAAWITRRDSTVVLPEMAVYEVGHTHRWVCACHRAGHGTAVQLDLFGAVA